MQKTQIALFPLDIILLPGENTQLHIFEERYRKLVEDCESVHISFGIPYTVDGNITGFGCVVELKKIIRRYPGGSMDVEIEAVALFKVDRFFLRLGEKPYPGGTVELIDVSSWPPVHDKVLKAADTYLLEKGETLPPELLSARANAMDIGKVIRLSGTDKLHLLKAETQSLREKILLETLAFFHLLQKQKKSIEGEIFLN